MTLDLRSISLCGGGPSSNGVSRTDHAVRKPRRRPTQLPCCARRASNHSMSLRLSRSDVPQRDREKVLHEEPRPARNVHATYHHRLGQGLGRDRLDRHDVHHGQQLQRQHGVPRRRCQLAIVITSISCSSMLLAGGRPRGVRRPASCPKMTDGRATARSAGEAVHVTC